MWHTSQWDAKKQVRCWNVWGCMVLIHVVVGLYYWEICLFGFEFSGHQGSEEGNNTDLVNQWWLSCKRYGLRHGVARTKSCGLQPSFHCFFIHAFLLEILLVRECNQTNNINLPVSLSPSKHQASDWYNFWDNGPCYSSWYLIWKEHNFKWDEYLIIWKNNSMDHHINWPNRKPTDHSCGENVFGMFCTSYIYNII